MKQVTCSILDSKKTYRRNMITKGKCDENGVKLETSQKKSLVSPAHQTGVSVSPTQLKKNTAAFASK